MLLTIITITRNNRAGLAKTAASIMEQSCKDYSWIIIDGNSDDGSHDDFTTYGSHAAILSEDDEGIYDAMNKGIALAEDDYTIFLNAGDCFADQNTLESLKNALGEHCPDLIYGDALEEDKNGTRHVKPARHHSTLHWGMFTHHQSMLYKTSRLKNYRFNPHYKIAADYDLTLRFIDDGAQCFYHPRPLCLFERGGLSQRQAWEGRIEQFMAKRHDIPFFKNMGIFALQTITHTLKTRAPSLYWFLRKNPAH